MSDSESRKLCVWDYFEKCNDGTLKAECLLCHKVLSCTTSHNLKHHLKCMHSDEVDVGNNLITRTRALYKKDYGPGSTRDLVKKAFTKVEGDKIAICNLCHKMLSYRTTIANLKHHLKTVHRNDYEKLLQTADDDDEEDSYFEVVEDEEGSAFFNQNSLNSKKRKYEVDGSETGEVYTEVIYLEEEDEEPKPSISKYNSTYSKYPSKRSLKKLFPGRRTMSINKTSENQSSDTTRMEQETVNNELDKFGQYIASLLSSMPKHVCTKLQMKIVNQVMEEKLKIETENEQNFVVENNSQANDSEENDMEESDRKYHKYIITGNADIVKNE